MIVSLTECLRSTPIAATVAQGFIKPALLIRGVMEKAKQTFLCAG